MTKAATALGMTLRELAGKLKVEYDRLRNWDRHDRRVPDEVRAAVDALLAAQPKGGAKTRVVK